MNKIFLGLGILATSMAMVSCSQDDFDNTVNNPTDDGSRLYTQLTISLPTAGSRAGDDYNGTYEGEEIGQDGENQINSLAIFLMDKISDSDYQFVTSTSVTNVTTNSVKPSYQAIFNGYDLKKYYEANKNLSEYKLWMFVVANPGDLSITKGFNPSESTFETSMFMSYDVERLITMSGVPYPVVFPNSVKELLQYDSESRPFNLTANGPVRVERSIARFDFKSTNNEIYEIKDNKQNVIGKIQLLDMAVVNERTEAYHFGRTSADGKNNNFKFELVAGFTTNQYVVSPNANDLTERGFYSKFDPTVKTASGINKSEGYVWKSIASLKDDDNDDKWNNTTPSKGDYKIWRYVNENTIPGTLNQTYGNSTGVIFRGTILDNKVDGKGIPGYGEGDIYLFQNKLYGTFNHLLDAVKAVDGDGNSTNPVLKHFFEEAWGSADSAVEGIYKVGQKPSDHGFTIYRMTETEDGPQYLTYYYYWNRHEDNGQGNEMGAMEFAVVRNNVYKLAVNSINRFGHTANPNDDPDPVDPDDPDEKENIFFKVDVTVLPWTVRMNNIDF